MWPNPQEIPDLVTFIEEILNGKLHFCAVKYALQNLVFKRNGAHTLLEKLPYSHQSFNEIDKKLSPNFASNIKWI